MSTSPADLSDPEDTSSGLSDPAESSNSPRWHLPSRRVLAMLAIVGLALLWLAPAVAAAVSAIDFSSLEHPYRVIFGFVVFDAVIPIFPSESLLNTASTLAAQDDSNIELWPLIVAGSLGAVVGDSLLYWLSRTVGRRSLGEKVERAQANPKVARSMEGLSQTAGTLIVFGRFVPGVRFMIGATMGLSRFPYRKFLVFDVIGGVLWASYACLFSYLVATVIEDKPIISLAISVIFSTAILAVLYRRLKRHWDEIAAVPTS